MLSKHSESTDHSRVSTSQSADFSAVILGAVTATIPCPRALQQLKQRVKQQNRQQKYSNRVRSLHPVKNLIRLFLPILLFFEMCAIPSQDRTAERLPTGRNKKAQAVRFALFVCYNSVHVTIHLKSS